MIKHTGQAEEPLDQTPTRPPDASPAAGRRRRRDGERPLRAAGNAVTTDDRGAQPDRRQRAGLNPGLLVGSTDEEILRCYLELVRGWRGSRQLAGMQLRRDDVAVLVAILGTDGAEIERRLVAATACSITTARRCRSLLLASVGALAVGLAGAPLAASMTFAPLRMSDETRPVASASAAPATTARGSFGWLDRLDQLDRPDQRDAVDIASVARVAPVAEPAPPDAAVAATGAQAPVVADVQPASTIAAVPIGTEAMVTIASLGIDLPIIAGGQSVIDQGVVAHYFAPGWEPPVPPGAPGTYWLAAHHTTHGAPFGALPDVAVGAEVRVTTNNQTFVYTITSTEVVGLFPGDVAVYGTDPTASVILLQTCIDSTLRFLVHGTLTATL